MVNEFEKSTKGNAYVKFILPRTLLSYKSTAENNQAAWRDLPPQFGNWNSIYHKFRLWGADDVFENILKDVLVNENFQLIGLLLTGGNIHDSKYATELLGKANLEGKTVLGYKVFCSTRIREFTQAQGAQFVFPTNPTREHCMISTKISIRLAMLLNAVSCEYKIVDTRHRHLL